MTEPKIYDVIIIGGGPAGMMAAITAAKRHKHVALLEKNAALGKKLNITGGGRCNITNATFDNQALLKNYGSAAKFLHSPFSQFAVEDTVDLFESLDFPLIEQDNRRMFPYTQKSVDVTRVLTKALKDLNVDILSSCQVLGITAKDHQISQIQSNLGALKATSYILATGGMSRPETGSTGDGLKWLQQTGHTIKEPTPSIVPLTSPTPWVKSLAGKSTQAKVTFLQNQTKAFAVTGRILFTHTGLSGPTILNSAAQVGELLAHGLVTATIDLFPNQNHDEIDARILKIFDDNKNKSLRNALKDIMPSGFAGLFTYWLPEQTLETKVHSISKEQRKQIITMAKQLPLDITSLQGFNKAVVTDGGVVLEEIDTKTMKSKLVSNLFVIGDALHIRRPSGGYSLQLCWTTGFVAGQHA